MLDFGISPDYVLRKMTMQEARTLLKYGYKRNQEQWEQTRWLATVIVNILSSKDVKATELIHFPWDSENKQPSPTPLPVKSDINDVFARAREIEKNMNNQ